MATNIDAMQQPGALRRRTPRLACPDIGALMRYRDRVVRVLAEACGQRVMIESLDPDGRRFVSTVKWASLTRIQGQLF